MPRAEMSVICSYFLSDLILISFQQMRPDMIRSSSRAAFEPSAHKFYLAPPK